MRGVPSDRTAGCESCGVSHPTTIRAFIDQKHSFENLEIGDWELFYLPDPTAELHSDQEGHHISRRHQLRRYE
jgi:hypothetical protein